MYAFKAVLAHTKCICLRHKYVRIQGCTCTYQMHMLETQICTHARLQKTCKQLASALACVRVYSSTGKLTEAATHLSGKCLRCFEHMEAASYCSRMCHIHTRAFHPYVYVCTYVRMYVCVSVCMYVCMCPCVFKHRQTHRGSNPLLRRVHTETATYFSAVYLRCFEHGGSQPLLSHVSHTYKSIPSLCMYVYSYACMCSPCVFEHGQTHRGSNPLVSRMFALF